MCKGEAVNDEYSNVVLPRGISQIQEQTKLSTWRPVGRNQRKRRSIEPSRTDPQEGLQLLGKRLDSPGLGFPATLRSRER